MRLVDATPYFIATSYIEGFPVVIEDAVRKFMSCQACEKADADQ